MKSLLVILSSILLCSCATMVVSDTDETTPGGRGVAAPTDAKDVGSGVYMTTNCGVGASNPRAIYVRPFCIDNAVFEGDEAASIGEMRILKDHETPRVGWLIDGEFRLVDGGSPIARFLFGWTSAGRSYLSLHVRVTDVQRHMVVYEFDMAGGSRLQGKLGTLRASGLGKATHFDLRNAAERIYLVLSTNPERYAA